MARKLALHTSNKSSILLASTITLISLGVLYYLSSPKSNEDLAFKSRECTHKDITEFGICEDCGDIVF